MGGRFASAPPSTAHVQCEAVIAPWLDRAHRLQRLAAMVLGRHAHMWGFFTALHPHTIQTG